MSVGILFAATDLQCSFATCVSVIFVESTAVDARRLIEAFDETPRDYTKPKIYTRPQKHYAKLDRVYKAP